MGAVSNRRRLACWTVAALLVVALLVALRTLPLERAATDLQEWIDDLGWLGPLVFAAIYVVAALLLLPSTVLMIAAGALYGLWLGTAIASLASTAAAALAFVIARYLARDLVAERVSRSARLRAIDRAIAESGTRIVALLRLSPAVPFSVANYAFGLTALRGVPYVVATWLFLLPGTFLYVWFGVAGARGLSAADDDVPGAGTLEWIAVGVAVATTAAVTVYVGRLAQRGIAEQTEGSDGAGPPAPARGAPRAPTDHSPSRS